MICPWTRLWWMGVTWQYEHKQNHKESSLKLLVRFWNNLIEIFLEWPFSELFLKFWSVNKHGISEWRLLALYRHKEILVNSSLKATKKKIGKSNLKKSGERSRAILALLLYFDIVLHNFQWFNIVFIKFFDLICLFQTLISNKNVFHQHTVLSQNLQHWVLMTSPCPAQIVQWWACRTHDLVFVSSIPGWGYFSFRHIFASHLWRSMWEK